MKKSPKTYIVWLLTGSIAFSTTSSMCSIETNETNIAAVKLDELVEQKKETKNLPLKKKIGLKGFVRELVSLAKKKLQIKREKAKKGKKLDSVQTLDDLKELFDIDKRQLNLYAKIAAAGIAVVLVIDLAV